MKLKLNCSLCGIAFEKEAGEHNRRIRKGQTNFYCSRSCGGRHQAAVQNISKNWGTQNHNLRRGGKTTDQFSLFKEHLRRVKRRPHHYDVTLEDLKEQWDRQAGKCVYTKVALKLHRCNTPIYMASLDRINSTYGYVKGNIQWISAAMNYAKNSMSHDDMLKLCEIIKHA